ncbi:SIR2 family protein [Lacrimispora sp.]|uniref:SIR2 family protein n=1 Tax=Lacrimispora sp. TaxID=2719234 RepID=UPI00345F8847
MTIEDIISQFNTTPFLFIGSGITRRYLNLPDWKGLLEYFARVIDDNSFAYSAYENEARVLECKAGIMPKIAELIQRDFDRKWFSTPDMRTVENEALEQIKNHGLSPFKAEVAAYIKRCTIREPSYEDEINKLSQISEKSIAGVITTNYDSFLEETLPGFTKYVGQAQLIFSSIQGIAEIYKIHGSVEDPGSIVINETDYVKFDSKSAYLAAKLMTIFMEYPIIFMGYSISDVNVQNIIKSIVNCLGEEQIKTLEDRFVFVEYKRDMVGAEVSPYIIMVDNKPLGMRKVALGDFMLLYCAMEGKKAKLPVKILRRFKQELYNYTITNIPTANLRVAALEDDRVADEELVLAIGKVSDLGLKGLSGIDSNEWYRNIVIGDLDFSADELLEYAYPKVLKQNSGRLPVNKYLSEAAREFPECKKLAERQDFDTIISATIKRNRGCLGNYISVKQIWKQEKHSLEKATRLMSHLEEGKIDVEELEEVLQELFENDVNLLQNADPHIRTNIRRLIMIYDYLKWGK